MNATEDVEFIVQSPAINFVEHLQPHKGVENNRLHFFFAPAFKYFGPSKVENESDDELQDRLTKDHFPHIKRNNRSSLRLGLSVE